MLLSSYSTTIPEAGCDEAGRGCLAGPVAAAAVILPQGFYNPLLNDSKKLNPAQRNELKKIIENEALAWAVAFVDNQTIDQINILKSSIMAMHKALSLLTVQPEFIIVDGNKFIPWENKPFCCIIKGDGKYNSIAAASILAKTARDEYMQKIHLEYPQYDWNKNFGYPTLQHKLSIARYGQTPYHRLTFNSVIQLKLGL
jgi:ribonuclease HII